MEKVVDACNISAADNIFRNIMSPFSNSLCNTLYGQLRRIEPEKKESNSIAFFLCTLNEIQVRPGGKSCFDRECLITT